MRRLDSIIAGARLQPSASGWALLYPCRITLNSFGKLSNLPEPPLIDTDFPHFTIKFMITLFALKIDYHAYPFLLNVAARSYHFSGFAVYRELGSY